MGPSPRPQICVFFRVCALVVFTWAMATAVMTERWWTRSVEGIPTPWIADRTASLGSAIFVGMVGAALLAYGLSGRGFIRALAWATALYGLALAVVQVERPSGTGPALLSAVALDVGAVMVAAMLLAIILMTACRRWLGRVYYKRRQAERAGSMLLLVSVLWTAFIRIAFAGRAPATNYMDVVLFAPVVFACLGLLALTWHGYWRIVSHQQSQPESPWLRAMTQGAQPLKGGKGQAGRVDVPSARTRSGATTRRLALLDIGEHPRDGDKTSDGEANAINST